MLVYYCCQRRAMKKAFENELVRALMRLDIDLWSDTVKVNMQPQILSDDFDDNMGNTNIAIVVLNKSFLADKVCVQKLKTLLKYKTIDIFWILNKTESTFACEMLKNDIDDIENLLEQEIVYDAEEGISNIATDLGLNIFSMKKNTGERISTGINALDYLLNGGLIKGSSINIIGSSGTGKTTLSVQIQKNVLESGLACLYITYSEAPRNILQRFKDLGCDIKKYIQEGKFKIYDSYSSLHGLSVEDVKISVGEEYYSAIVRVEDPYDSEKYFTEQINTIREIGPGGVNIIDCVNVRYQITEKQKEKDEVTYKEHFSRLLQYIYG